MHGLGDNLHQRALVRALIGKGYEVWLETPWPCVYHDLRGENLKLIGGSSFLRTQDKNARREARAFDGTRPPPELRRGQVLRVHYPPQLVRERGSVLAAMLAACGQHAAPKDFRLPVPPDWEAAADRWLARWGRPDKPLMIYRPLVERKEWGGNKPRNPDPETYAALFEAIRERFFVVSIADLAPGLEWTVGPAVRADVELHRGQLTFEALAALTRRAGLVFAAPGFAIVLAQAVGAPNVAVFGGYENGSSFRAGAGFAPHLALEPINPCQCFSHAHPCDKRMDAPLALARLQAFVGANACSI